MARRSPRIIAIAALVAALVTFVSAALPAWAQAAKTTIRAAYVPVATWLPAWVAKEKGIFEKHQLDVSLTPNQNLSTLIGAVGRQFDIAPSTAPDLLKAVASGIDLVAVAGETIEQSGNPTVMVIVRKDSGITSVKQLAGKRIATPSLGAVIHVSVLHWLKQHGVDPASINPVEVPFPNMGDQLKAGRVDAVEALQPFTGQLLQAGNVSLGDPLLSVGDPVLFPFWIAQAAWARENRTVIGRWIRALTEARAWIEQNDKEARAIMAKYTRLPAAVAEKIPLPTYRFSIRPEQLKVWITVLKDLDQLRGNVDSSRLVVTAE